MDDIEKPMKEHSLEITWEESKDRARAAIPGLGHIDIYWDSGWAVDINGQRAWSAWRGTIGNVQLGMQDKVRGWAYLNSMRKAD